MNEIRRCGICQNHMTAPHPTSDVTECPHCGAMGGSLYICDINDKNPVAVNLMKGAKPAKMIGYGKA